MIYGTRPSGVSPQPAEACAQAGLSEKGSGRIDAVARCAPVWTACWRWVALRPVRPEPVMTLPRTVADVLSEHVSFEVECIDRMYLNVYVPQLQYATGLVSYIHRQLGMPVASTAALAPVSEAFTRSVRSFAASCGIPWVDFAKGQRKDDVAQEYLAGFTGTEGVLFIGRAQEKVPLFRTRKRRRADGSSYPWIAAETGVVNQYYCYCVDADFGPFFLKFCSYFPFNAKLCINGNEWAKRQAAKAGIGFTPLDNAFAAVDDVAAVQAICDALGPAQIDALLRKWLARLPHPFSPADRAAGYRYDISILQAEFSLTQMLDKPVSSKSRVATLHLIVHELLAFLVVPGQSRCQHGVGDHIGRGAGFPLACRSRRSFRLGLKGMPQQAIFRTNRALATSRLRNRLSKTSTKVRLKGAVSSCARQRMTVNVGAKRVVVPFFHPYRIPISSSYRFCTSFLMPQPVVDVA